MTKLTEDQRRQLWEAVIRVLADYTDPNAKAGLVQSCISEYGPVPNELGDAVRKAMKV